MSSIDACAPFLYSSTLFCTSANRSARSSQAFASSYSSSEIRGHLLYAISDEEYEEALQQGQEARLVRRQVDVGGAEDEGLIPLVTAALDEGRRLGVGAGDDNARHPHHIQLEAGGVEALDLLVLGDQHLAALVAALLDPWLLVLDVVPGNPDLDESPDQVADMGLAAVAGRSVADPDVVAGAGLFVDVGCAACHVPAFTTSVVEVRGLSGQFIIPFTDLLLHDLGPGLSDDRSVYAATGAEWRTAPLWGIGLLEEVNGQLNLLHDGRARSVEEAVLWHGGEAVSVTDRFMRLSADDRRRLLQFVESR